MQFFGNPQGYKGVTNSLHSKKLFQHCWANFMKRNIYLNFQFCRETQTSKRSFGEPKSLYSYQDNSKYKYSKYDFLLLNKFVRRQYH